MSDARVSIPPVRATTSNGATYFCGADLVVLCTWLASTAADSGTPEAVHTWQQAAALVAELVREAG